MLRAQRGTARSRERDPAGDHGQASHSGLIVVALTADPVAIMGHPRICPLPRAMGEPGARLTGQARWACCRLGACSLSYSVFRAAPGVPFPPVLCGFLLQCLLSQGLTYLSNLALGDQARELRKRSSWVTE